MQERIAMNDMTKKMIKQLRMLEVQNKNIIDSEMKFTHMNLSEQELNHDLSHNEDTSDLLFEQIIKNLKSSGYSIDKMASLINEAMASKNSNLPYCNQNEIAEVLKSDLH